MFTYFYAHIRPLQVYTLLRPYTPFTGLHTSTPIYLYRFTYFYVYVPLSLYIFLRHYRLYTYLHTSTAIYLYMFTDLYTHTCPIHDCTLLHTVHMRLQTSTLIYLYEYKYLYAHIPIHECILLRPYPPYTCLHTSTDVCIYIFISFYVLRRYMLIYFHAHIFIQL
jgi:hypothetical protein